MTHVLRQKFTEMVAQWKLRYFTADELLARVGAKRGNVTNGMPPEAMWPNILPTAKVVDELRRRLGVPIHINSGYRDQGFNRAIGGVGRSQHMEFRALDISSKHVTPRQIHSALKLMRSEGRFRGGLGLYKTFVHIDTRLTGNADWLG